MDCYFTLCHNNDATSALNETCDDASTLLDKTVPLGEFRDEQLAKARELENIEIDAGDTMVLFCRLLPHLYSYLSKMNEMIYTWYSTYAIWYTKTR